MIQNLQDLLEHKKTEKENLEKRVKDLETAQGDKTTELETKATELEAMRETVRLTQSGYANLQAEIKRLQVEIKRLESVVAARDMSILQLKFDDKAYDSLIKGLKVDLAERTRDAANNKVEDSAYKLRIEQQEYQIKQLDLDVVSANAAKVKAEADRDKARSSTCIESTTYRLVIEQQQTEILRLRVCSGLRLRSVLRLISPAPHRPPTPKSCSTMQPTNPKHSS